MSSCFSRAPCVGVFQANLCYCRISTTETDLQLFAGRGEADMTKVTVLSYSVLANFEIDRLSKFKITVIYLGESNHLMETIGAL